MEDARFALTPKGEEYLARRRPPVAPGLSPLDIAARTGANAGDPLAAVRVTARWCASVETSTDPLCPPLAGVLSALAVAVAAGDQVTRAELDALALAVSRWCENASSDAYDNAALAPLVLAAVNAAAALACAAPRR